MKKIKNKITIEKIGFIILLITIIMLNICIGSNIKHPVWIIQTMVSIFTLIYLIISKKQKKENIIIKSKIDIVVLLFMISTAIPLVFKTYTTLEGVCNFVLKYWSVYGVYILTRNIVKEKKQIKIIINTIIVSSIIPIIIGIDMLTLKILEPILKLIDAVNIEDLRMVSTFGYANTLAAYLGLTTSLAISELVNTKGKRKILYLIYILFATISIILTQSKLVLALLVFIIFLFIVKAIKNKMISKKWITIGVVTIIIFVIYISIAIQIDKPLKIEQEEKVCIIRDVEPNQEYELEFDIKAKTNKNYDTFEITIVEINRYLSEKIKEKITFSNFEGIKKINLETGEQPYNIEIRIKNRLNQELIINELKVNGEKNIIEYKIIPEEIARIFTTFNFKYSSVWQRVDYWRDGLDILKDNWILGAGGNAWRMLYGQVQDYLYYAKEIHCYILEIWISFGLIGIISYIFIIAITIQNSEELIKRSKKDKEKNKNIIAIIVGISIIVIHSIMDFDMSFLIIEMVFYMLIAILNEDDIKIQKNTKICDIIIILIFIMISIGNILGLTAKLIEKKDIILSSKIAPWVSRYQYNSIVRIENNKIENTNKMKYLKNYIKNEPYQYQNTIYEITCNEIIKNSKKEDIEYIINVWKEIEIERKYEVEQIRKRAEVMLKFAKNLMQKEEKEYAKEVLQLIVQEYEQNNTIILDYSRNKISESMTKFEHEYYTNTYKEAVEFLED